MKIFNSLEMKNDLCKVFLKKKKTFGKFMDKNNCGAKGSKDSGPFYIKPKAHAEEEEMSDDEQRESRLPGYTAKDDPVLDRPKSRKGKTPRH